MKILTLFLFLCLPILASEEDKVALRNLKAIYEKAIADQDLSSLESHLAKDFTAVMITADEVKGYDGIVKYWNKVIDFLGQDGTYQVSIDPDDTIFDGNIAIATGRAKEHAVRGGKALEFTSKWTAVARKEGGDWKLVRIQASIDPINNPLLAAVNGFEKWIIGGLALVVGVVVGRLLPRKKA